MEKAGRNTKLREGTHNAIGLVYSEEKEYKESLKYFEKAVGVCIQFEGQKKSLDVCYRNLGSAHEYDENLRLGYMVG